MKNIYINTNEKLLKEAFVKILKAFGFAIVVNKEKADFILNDFDDKIVFADKEFFKPVNFFEVIKNISNTDNIFFNDINVSFLKKSFSKDGKVVNFTDMEFSILSLLINNIDGVDVDDMLVKIFGRVGESQLKSLSTHIYNLRKKLLNFSKNKDNIILKNSRYILNL